MAAIKPIPLGAPCRLPDHAGANHSTFVLRKRDDGQSWAWDWIIRNDAPDWALGYPSTAELADGSLFTVYYQKFAAGEHCSLLWSRWQLP